MNGERETSSTGLSGNVAGLLTYLLGWVTGIAFLVIERRSSFVRFHALQSTVTFLGISAAQLLVNLVPVLGTLASAALGVLSFVLWIYLMVQAYRGERTKLPWVGDIAEERAALPG